MFFTCTCRPECCKCTCQCKQSISKNRAVIEWEDEEDGWMYGGTEMMLWSSKGQTEWNHAFLYALKESIDIMDDVNMWHEQSQWEVVQYLQELNRIQMPFTVLFTLWFPYSGRSKWGKSTAELHLCGSSTDSVMLFCCYYNFFPLDERWKWSSVAT